MNCFKLKLLTDMSNKPRKRILLATRRSTGLSSTGSVTLNPTVFCFKSSFK